MYLGEELHHIRQVRKRICIQLGTIKKTRQISVYLCIIYGIVIIEIYNYNKELYTYKVAYSFSLYCLSVQRLENPKTSVVYHGAPIYM